MTSVSQQQPMAGYGTEFMKAQRETSMKSASTRFETLLWPWICNVIHNAAQKGHFQCVINAQMADQEEGEIKETIKAIFQEPKFRSLVQEKLLEFDVHMSMKKDPTKPGEKVCYLDWDTTAEEEIEESYKPEQQGQQGEKQYTQPTKEFDQYQISQGQQFQPQQQGQQQKGQQFQPQQQGQQFQPQQQGQQQQGQQFQPQQQGQQFQPQQQSQQFQPQQQQGLQQGAQQGQQGLSEHALAKQTSGSAQHILPLARPTTRSGRPRPRPVAQTIRTNVEGGGAQTLTEVFNQILVQQIAMDNWTRKRLVLVGKKQPLERALSRLNTHNILSLPVVDDDTKDVIGLIDVQDVIAVLQEDFETREAQGQMLTRLRWDALMRPIAEVLDRKTQRKTYLVSVTSSMKDGIRELAKSELQRVMIVDREFPTHPVIEMTEPEPNVIGILSQMDVMRFLAENCAWMDREEIFHQTIEQLGLGDRIPVTIQESAPIAEGFQLMHKEQVGGVALINNEGKLVGNLSASNIKGISRRNFQLLRGSISEFLLRDRRRGWWALPVCFSKQDTLKHIILQFVATKVHRMYLVDENTKPIGEINLTDCMRQLLNLHMA